jgi:hypothetical protein
MSIILCLTWGCEQKTIIELLSAARLQSFVRASQKDFRLSSAAIHLFVFQFGEAKINLIEEVVLNLQKVQF